MKGIREKSCCKTNYELINFVARDTKCDEPVWVSRYLQSYNYFIHAKDRIVKEFTCKENYRTSSLELLNELLEGASTSLDDPRTIIIGFHIRRTDLFSPTVIETRFGATDVYLNRAVNYVINKYPGQPVYLNELTRNDSASLIEEIKQFDFAAGKNETWPGERKVYYPAGVITPVIVLIGDDTDYNVKYRMKVIKRTRTVVVTPPVSNTIPEDFCLLTHTQSVLISSGSFGWWAGFLGQNQPRNKAMTAASDEKRFEVMYIKEQFRGKMKDHINSDLTEYMMPDWIPL